MKSLKVIVTLLVLTAVAYGQLSPNTKVPRQVNNEQTPAGKILQQAINETSDWGEISTAFSEVYVVGEKHIITGTSPMVIELTHPINLRDREGLILRNLNIRVMYTNKEARSWPVFDLVGSKRIIMDNVHIDVPVSSKVKPGCLLLMARNVQVGSAYARSASRHLITRSVFYGYARASMIYNVGSEIARIEYTDIWNNERSHNAHCYYASPYNDLQIISPFGPFAGKQTFGGGTSGRDSISNIVHDLRNCHFGYLGNSASVVVKSGKDGSGLINVFGCDFSVKGNGRCAIYVGQKPQGYRYSMWGGTIIGNQAEHANNELYTADVVFSVDKFYLNLKGTPESYSGFWEIEKLNPGFHEGVIWKNRDGYFTHP
jgi:hypothetical protein